MHVFLRIRQYILSLFRLSPIHEVSSGEERNEADLVVRDSENLAVVLRSNAEEKVNRAAENFAAHMGMSWDVHDTALPFSEKIVESVVQPLSQIEHLCAEYAHGIYAPNFPQILERLSLELTDSNWTDGDALAFDKSIKFQSCVDALPKENHYGFTHEQLLDISQNAKNHEDHLLSQKQKNWEEYLTKVFVNNDVKDLIYFMKYKKLD